MDVRREKLREMLVEQAKCGASGGHGIKPGRKMCTAPIPSCLFHPISSKHSKSKLEKKEDKSTPRDKKKLLCLSPLLLSPFWLSGRDLVFFHLFFLYYTTATHSSPFRSNQLMEQLRDTTKTRAIDIHFDWMMKDT